MDEKFFNKASDLIISLLDNGYLLTNKVYPAANGDCVYFTYSNGGTKMRITRDRGIYLVDALPAALNKDEWIGVARVTRFLKSRRPGDFIACPEKSNSWNGFVVEVGSNIRLINSFFKPKTFLNNYEVLELFEEKNGRPELSFPEAA